MFMTKSTDQLRAYLIDVTFFTWPEPASGYHHLVIASQTVPNKVNVTIDISDLGNLLTDLEGQLHYIEGRVRYVDKKRQIIPVYGSIEEIRSNAQMSDLTYRVR